MLKCIKNRKREPQGSVNRFRSGEASRANETENNPYEDYPPLKISIEDLFRFWWNHCIDQYLFVDEILEDIYDYFTEQMRPQEKEKESMDLTLDFGKLPLFLTEQEQAA